MKEEGREDRNKGKVVIRVVHGEGKLEKNYRRGKGGGQNWDLRDLWYEVREVFWKAEGQWNASVMEVEYCWLEENLEKDNSNSSNYGRKQDGRESKSMFIPSNNVDS